ncbi:hypothetical protein FRC04_011683 [Tulasnella sp. 424]|nr:hypothetical protein FRC04_011683 [Tulasnella sp. 424]
METAQKHQYSGYVNGPHRATLGAVFTPPSKYMVKALALAAVAGFFATVLAQDGVSDTLGTTTKTPSETTATSSTTTTSSEITTTATATTTTSATGAMQTHFGHSMDSLNVQAGRDQPSALSHGPAAISSITTLR